MKAVTLAPATAEQKEITLQPASEDIWDKKYRLKSKEGESIDQSVAGTYERVAEALAKVETTQAKQKKWYKHFLWALQNGAIPAGRIMSNAGAQEHKPATSTINCTVSSTVPDSMNGILSSVHEAGLTLKAGCGIGYEFSTLRPKGAFVSGAGAYTSGPLSFMDIFDAMCSPSLLPVVAVAHKWARLIFPIPISLTSFAPNVRMVACASSTCRAWSPKNSWKQ